MAKATKRGRGPAVEDVQPDLSLEPEIGEEFSPLNEEWIEKFIDPKASFFDALTEIPDGGWDKVCVYLYRLDPAVANKVGEKKYIAVYGQPITEQMIKEQHGGGKFHAYVKYGKATLRNHRFSIEGPPILLEGQTARGGPPNPAGVILPPSGEAGIANIVRQVIEATKGDTKAADAGIEVMKRAMMDGLDITKTIATSQANSATGSTIGDKLLAALLPRLTEPQNQTLPPMVEKFMDAAITIFKSERRDPNPATTPPATDQLSLVKELLGVDSLREVIELGGRRGAETPFWVTLVSNALDRLPTLLKEFADMQERGFQRAIIAHQLGAGQPGAMPPPGWQAPQPAPVIRTAAPSGSAAPPAAPPMPGGEMTQQMIAAIVDGICRAYDEGYPGDVAGAHIRLLYPELVDSLRPLLTNPAQLSGFVSQMPPLADRAREPEWADFQQEFIEELGQVQASAGVIEPPTIAAAAPATVSRGTPPARPAGRAQAEPKKKANGSAT